MTKGSCPLQ